MIAPFTFGGLSLEAGRLGLIVWSDVSVVFTF